jgi:hypothetical protein
MAKLNRQQVKNISFLKLQREREREKERERGERVCEIGTKRLCTFVCSSKLVKTSNVFKKSPFSVI